MAFSAVAWVCAHNVCTPQLMLPHVSVLVQLWSVVRSSFGEHTKCQALFGFRVAWAAASRPCQTVDESCSGWVRAADRRAVSLQEVGSQGSISCPALSCLQLSAVHPQERSCRTPRDSAELSLPSNVVCTVDRSVSAHELDFVQLRSHGFVPPWYDSFLARVSSTSLAELGSGPGRAAGQLAGSTQRSDAAGGMFSAGSRNGSLETAEPTRLHARQCSWHLVPRQAVAAPKGARGTGD